MRILRICVMALFVCAALAFAVFFVRAQIRNDDTAPVISMESGVLSVSVSDGEDALLSGVTASDEKDGDLTDHVVIESVSNFLTLGECNVRYAVCDSGNNVVTAERRIRYTDYESPHFYVRDSLCFSTMESVNILSLLGAEDMIDGDITENVIIGSSDYDADVAGVYHVSVEAMNSKGDSIDLQLPVYVEERGYSVPHIALSSYLTYINVGEKLDYRSMVTEVTDFDGNKLDDVKLTYDSGLRSSQPGVYTVHYYATPVNEDGTVDRDQRGHAVMIVVVEE